MHDALGSPALTTGSSEATALKNGHRSMQTPSTRGPGPSVGDVSVQVQQLGQLNDLAIGASYQRGRRTVSRSLRLGDQLDAVR